LSFVGPEVINNEYAMVPKNPIKMSANKNHQITVLFLFFALKANMLNVRPPNKDAIKYINRNANE
jgi:hypothetical protein